MKISWHPQRAPRLLSIAALAATVLLALPDAAVRAGDEPPNRVYRCDESTLRSVITNAPIGATVTFGCSGTITLTATITLNKNLTIDGSGQTVTISGGTSVQVFVVNSGVAVTLTDLTITDGNAGDGGGILNGGTLSVSDSTFSGNSVTRVGGGIANEGIGTLTVSNTTFSGNSAAEVGGGIVNWGTLSISDSTFSGNSATLESGGIANTGTLTVTNSTFSDNSGEYGSGIGNDSGTANVANTILTNSTQGPNCTGTITDLGGNLDSGTSCGFHATIRGSNSLSNTDPQLLPLADNGGPTQTVALESTSPAIDLGMQPYCTEAEPHGAGDVDQRGYRRDTTLINPTCDAGAYEYGGQAPPHAP